MAEVKISKVDAFGALIPLQGVRASGHENGLNLGAGTYAALDSRESNIITVAMKCLLLVYLKISGTDLTVKLDIFDEGGAANFGAPDLTMTEADTEVLKILQLAAGKSFQLEVSSTAGGVIEDGFVFPLQHGFDMRALSYGMAAVPSDAAYPSFAVTA